MGFIEGSATSEPIEVNHLNTGPYFRSLESRWGPSKENPCKEARPTAWNAARMGFFRSTFSRPSSAHPLLA